VEGFPTNNYLLASLLLVRIHVDYFFVLRQRQAPPSFRLFGAYFEKLLSQFWQLADKLFSQRANSVDKEDQKKT